MAGGKVWITRTHPGAERTGDRVAALGFEPLIAPLLSTRPLEAALDLAASSIVAVTSTNALGPLCALSKDRSFRLYAVGGATAAAARRLGFLDVRSADGDVEDLARLIAHDQPDREIVHVSGEETAGDLIGRLGELGLAGRRCAVYRTEALSRTPAEVRSACADHTLKWILLYSPKAGRVLAELLVRELLPTHEIGVAGLSEACAAPVTTAPWRVVRIAAHPEEAELLNLLGTL